jgi:MoxR-like ATPase
MEVDVKKIGREVEKESAFVRRLLEELRKVIVGQEALLEALVAGLLSNGHILLEGVPGLAKTLSVSTLARAIRAGFHRIQFTPDLLPADLIGTLISSSSWRRRTPSSRRGPIPCPRHRWTGFSSR